MFQEGKENILKKPNHFEQEITEYNIVEDMKKMQSNINLAQLVKLNSKLASELAKATKHERVLRSQQ